MSLVLIAATMLVVIVAPGSAAHAGVQRDHVRGKGTHLGADAPYPRITVRIDASSNVDGSDPSGEWALNSRDIGQRRRGTVTCLMVQGNTATVGIKIVKAEDPSVVGKGELWKVVDNGQRGDEIAGYEVTDTPPTVCPALDFSVPVVNGNYRIFDAAP